EELQQPRSLQCSLHIHLPPIRSHCHRHPSPPLPRDRRDQLHLLEPRQPLLKSHRILPNHPLPVEPSHLLLKRIEQRRRSQPHPLEVPAAVHRQPLRRQSHLQCVIVQRSRIHQRPIAVKNQPSNPPNIQRKCHPTILKL